MQMMMQPGDVFTPHPFAKAATVLQMDPVVQIKHGRLSELRQLQQARSADCLIGVQELSDLFKCQAMVDRKVAPQVQLRAAPQAVPVVAVNNCCAGHGDIPSQQDDFQKMMNIHTVQLRRDGFEPIPIAPSVLAITKYWEPFLKAERMSKKKQRERVFRFTAQRVCKLHQYNKCNYGIECRNIHICRYFWANELPALIQSYGADASHGPKLLDAAASVENPACDCEDEADMEDAVLPLQPPVFQPRLHPSPLPYPADKPAAMRPPAMVAPVRAPTLPEMQSALQLSQLHLPPPPSVAPLPLPAPLQQRPAAPVVEQRGLLPQPTLLPSQTVSRGQPRHRQYLMMQPPLPAPTLQPPLVHLPPQLPQPALLNPPPPANGFAARERPPPPPPPPPLQASASATRLLYPMGLPPPPRDQTLPGPTLQPPQNRGSAARRLLRNVSRAELEDLPVRQPTPLRVTTVAPEPSLASQSAGRHAPPADKMTGEASADGMSAMDWSWQLAALGSDRTGRRSDAPKEKITTDEYRAMLTYVAEKKPTLDSMRGASANSLGSSESDLMERLMEKLPLDLQKELDATTV